MAMKLHNTSDIHQLLLQAGTAWLTLRGLNNTATGEVVNKNNNSHGDGLNTMAVGEMVNKNNNTIQTTVLNTQVGDNNNNSYIPIIDITTTTTINNNNTTEELNTSLQPILYNNLITPSKVHTTTTTTTTTNNNTTTADNNIETFIPICKSPDTVLRIDNKKEMELKEIINNIFKERIHDDDNIGMYVYSVYIYIYI